MSIKSFTNIDAWIKARSLVSDIYKFTGSDSMKYDYSFKDQIRRASVSIMSNIAEGFDSGTDKSFISFLNYSYRSASEVESLLYVALDVGYIHPDCQEKLILKTQEIKRLIGGFIKYLKSKQ